MRTLALALIIFFSFAHTAFAQTGGASGSWDEPSTGGIQTSVQGKGQTQTSVQGTGQDIKLINPLKGSGNLMSFLQSILDFVIKIGTVVVILMMVFVGYKFVVAQGAPDKIKEARDALLWTLVGALILLGSKAIAFGIEKTVQAISVGG